MHQLAKPTILAGLILAAMTIVAPASADLRAKMSTEEFSKAGLDKLSARELAFLNQWLNGEQAPVPPETPAAPAPEETAATPTERFGIEQVERPIEPDVPVTISARLVGEFRGWNGTTRFKLDNGQIWEQRVGGSYRSRKLVDPQVLVERGRFGYYLKVEGVKRTVGVRRIR